MKKTAAVVLAALALAAPLGAAHASGIAVTIATPQFGLQIGAPVYVPQVFVPAPVVIPAPVLVAPPVYVPQVPVVAVPRVVAVPPVFPVVYPYAVAKPGKHAKRMYPGAYRAGVPVAGYAYSRY
jgi:hypothetical protein